MNAIKRLAVDKRGHPGPDVIRLTLRERRFLFGYLLSGNATQTYLAVVMQVGSQAEHAHQAASRMLGRIKRRIKWRFLLEQLDVGALNMVRELEADLLARRTSDGDGAAALLAEVLASKRARIESILTQKSAEIAQFSDIADISEEKSI
ncbi:MAG: hypothetical protein ABSB63_16095 [Spirochaetia bacterium]|jgi:hypothetical protein